ncbi:hypothetical protein ACF0H5_008747 [Mactra antiquata]
MQLRIVFVEVFITVSSINALNRPDFESSWLPIRSQVKDSSAIRVTHGLGEIPLIVDVQVKSIDDPNNGFLFPAVGGQPRDDDSKDKYGGVLYVYNDREVTVTVPCRSNNSPSGSALYLDDDEYYTGFSIQTSHDVLIRVRAWKASSLPEPNFQKTDIFVEARSANVDEVYIEETHGLNEYPKYILVRAKHLDSSSAGNVSDGLGASVVSYADQAHKGNGYFIYGYNDNDVRIWIASDSNGYILDGADGYGLDESVLTAYIEIYAWSDFPKANEFTTHLGPDILDEQFEIPIERLHPDDFVRAFVESMSGINEGYRFLGSGALAIASTITDPGCSYGGLVYGYGHEKIRFWRPTDNGGLICIGQGFGDGNASDKQANGIVVITRWPTWNTIICTSFE